MKKTFYLSLSATSLALAAFALLPGSVVAVTYIFSHNLQLGMTDPDVKQLQIILNSDPDTRVALSGSGSPLHETSYFGALTKRAVIKYQNKYAQDILVPSHISAGTGYVGVSTRAKLNSLGSAATSPSKNVQNTPTNNGSVTFRSLGDSQQASVDTSLMSALRLYRVTPYQVKPGGTITITGDNLTADGTLHIGDSYTVAMSAGAQKSDFTAVLPRNLPEGTYNIWVTKGTQSSFRANMPIKLVVTATPKPAPTITGSYPSALGDISTPIVVKGTGFTGNVQVYSRFGLITVSPADSTTLTFKPADFPRASDLKTIIARKPSVYTYTVGFYVITDAGVSSTAGTFIVQ